MRTRKTMSKRVARLFDRTKKLKDAETAVYCVKLVMGPLVEQLPRDYTGERHTVISKRLGFDDQGREHVEYKEVAGPEPKEQEEPRITDDVERNPNGIGHIIEFIFM